jgi:hypothetical protein
MTRSDIKKPEPIEIIKDISDEFRYSYPLDPKKIH